MTEGRDSPISLIEIQRDRLRQSSFLLHRMNLLWPKADMPECTARVRFRG